MNTFLKAIKAAKNLNELCDALNQFESHIEKLNSESSEFYRSGDYVDMCDLQVFSENEPVDTCEIFSYDDTHCLIQNTCTGDAWEIVERTEEFGA
jgi:hypothetical protein